jgi:hypothetical protein
MSDMQLPQPDISEVIDDLTVQVARLLRDSAIQRSIINQLNKKIAQLETTDGSTAPQDN